jgi:hypothetical protein
MGDLSIFRASVLKFSAAQDSVRHRTKHQTTRSPRTTESGGSEGQYFNVAAASHRCRKLQGLQVQSASAARRSAQRGALAHSIDDVVLEESDLKGSRLCNGGLACKCARPGLVPNSRHARGCRRPEPRVLGNPHTVSPSLGTFVTLRADRPTLRIPYR